MHSSLLLVAALCIATAEAFVAPAALVSKRPPATTATTSWLFNGLDDFATSHFLSDNDLITTSTDVFQNGGGIMDTITTVLTGLIGVVFFLVGLTYVMAAIIIPQAAQQLEQQTKELDPELWASYEAQLEPGQTMDQRPDLMQELGETMQALMEAKFKEQQQQQVQGEATQEKESVRPQVLDAEIVSKDTSKVGGDDDPWAG